MNAKTVYFNLNWARIHHLVIRIGMRNGDSFQGRVKEMSNTDPDDRTDIDIILESGWTLRGTAFGPQEEAESLIMVIEAIDSITIGNPCDRVGPDGPPGCTCYEKMVACDFKTSYDCTHCWPEPRRV